MAQVYSAYEAKARFSEVLRKVLAGQRIVISYHGKEVAEIAPVRPRDLRTEESLQRLEDLGLLGPAAERSGRLRRVAGRPGALRRFLESRE